MVTLDGNTPYDLDPLRIFTDRAAAERYGLGLLSLLTGTAATGSDATTLRAAVADVLDSERWAHRRPGSAPHARR